jgi:putative membrane protein
VSLWQLGGGWADRPWCWDRPCGWFDRPWWAEVLAWLVPILLIVLVALLVVWVVTRTTRRPASPAPPSPATDAPLEQARMRYARGEIDRETYLQLARDLGGALPGGGGPDA